MPRQEIVVLVHPSSSVVVIVIVVIPVPVMAGPVVDEPPQPAGELPVGFE